MGTDKRIYHHHLSSVKPPPVDIDGRAVAVSSILNIRRLPVSNCSNESASYRQGRDSVPMFLHRGGMGRVKVGMSPGKMRGALTLKLGTVHMNRSVVGRRKLVSQFRHRQYSSDLFIVENICKFFHCSQL